MQKRGWAGVIAGAVLVSGCAADVMMQALELAEENFSIRYTPQVQGPYRLEPGLQAVTPLTYRRHAQHADGACDFKGVVVPWERTWDIPASQDGSQPAQAAQPGVVAGHAAVIYERVCPAQAVQSLLHAGFQGTGVLRAKNSVTVINTVGAQDVLHTPAAHAPQWTQQVLERVVALAPTDAAAREVVLTAHRELTQALPAQQAAIAAVLQAGTSTTPKQAIAP